MRFIKNALPTKVFFNSKIMTYTIDYGLQALHILVLLLWTRSNTQAMI